MENTVTIESFEDAIQLSQMPEYSKIKEIEFNLA